MDIYASFLLRIGCTKLS